MTLVCYCDFQMLDGEPLMGLGGNTSGPHQRINKSITLRCS